MVNHPVFLGIDTEIAEENLTVYPNPTTGIINLNGPNIESITAYSADGKEIIHKTTLPFGTMSLDLSDFENGLYILKITTTSGKRYVKKINLTQ